MPDEMMQVMRVDRHRQYQQRYDADANSRRETMKWKEEAGHARRDRGDQKPFGTSVETFTGEQSEQNDQAGKNSDQADQYMNDCVDVQYHDRPITVTSARNVTFRCNSSTLTITHCPGICVSFVGSSVYCATQPPSTTSEVPTVNFASSEQRYRTAAAISSVTPDRPTGIIDVI